MSAFFRKCPFHGAFVTAAGHPEPPGPTPLLSDPLRLVLVPTTDTTVQQFDFSALTSLPSTTLELRTKPSPNHHSLPIHPSTDLASLQSSTFHCSNLYDLLIILPRLTPSQIAAIHTLKVRWYTAVCILWKVEHTSHSSHVSSSSLRALSELDKIIVDCEGRDSWQVREMKKELEACFGSSRFEVTMVGGKEARVWGESVAWGFGRLGG